MTPRQVNKIYSHLTASQLATLGYEACISCDEWELEQIANAVTKFDYYAQHHYKCRLNHLSNIISTWGIEYWQAVAGIACYAHLDATNTPFSQTHEGELYSKLSGLCMALLAVCENSGIQLDKVLKYLSVDTEHFNQLCKSPANNLHDEYKEMFLKILQ